MSTQPQSNPSSNNVQPFPGDAGQAAVLNALRGLRFGSIEVVVHNGRIVQVERREKVRIESGNT